MPTQQFRASIADFVKKADQRATGFCRQFCFSAAEAVIVGGNGFPGTPVDTGFARGSWQARLNAPPPAGAGKPDKGGSATLSAVSITVAGIEPGDTFYLTNAANYILALEYGSSAQAPQGMVRQVAGSAQKLAQITFNQMGIQ